MMAEILMTLTPLILAALGGLWAYRAGVLNIALEGCMSAGAFAAAAAILLTGNTIIGFIASAAAGALLGGLLALTHLGLGSNLFIAGLGINLAAPGLIALISQAVWGHKGILRLPGVLSAAPSPLGIPLTVWILLPAALVLSQTLDASRAGRRLRCAGERPEFLEERGIPSWRPRALALTASSAAAALAGAVLALRVGTWAPGMSAGRGWMALVLIWLGFRHAWGVLGAALFFTIAELFFGLFQGRLGLPSTLYLGFPYLSALLIFIGSAMGRRIYTPSNS